MNEDINILDELIKPEQKDQSLRSNGGYKKEKEKSKENAFVKKNNNE
ncbi:hypothetical protein [Ginsengibacter hankyongi]|nr:hypothetical protein [Ginsengibacter hankyongi]